MKNLLAKLHRDPYLLVLTLGITIFCLYSTVAGILRYEHFLARKLDLGNMMQTIWNTGQGNFFQFTYPYSTDVVSRLGTHADFFLILLTPLYMLFPSAWTLLIFQAVVVGAGAVFVYLISKKLIGNPLYSVLFGFLYLLNPSVIRSSIYDFHAVVLSTTFLLAAWYFLIHKKWFWVIFWCILAGITKEQVWIITGLLALYVAWKEKLYKSGIFLALLSFGIFYFLFTVAIPNASHGQHFVLGYYAEYGEESGSVLKGVFADPLHTALTITNEERRSFLWQIFSPLSIFPFASPLYLIFMAPELLGYLVSNNHNMHLLYYHYTATLTPFIFISAIYGCAFILKHMGNMKARSSILLPVFLIGFFFSFRYSPFPYSREPQVDMFKPATSEMKEMNTYLKSIPSYARVSASDDLGAHLANRKYLYIFPLGVDLAEYVAIDKAFDSKNVSIIKSIDSNPAFMNIFENKTYVIYRRN